MTDAECLAEFRFKKRDIPSLVEVLGVPETIKCEQGTLCDGMEGLCMLLRRLSSPCRYLDMIPRFTKAVPVISLVTNTVVDFLYDIHGHRITKWNHNILGPDQMEMYAAGITARGDPLKKMLWLYRRHRETYRSPRRKSAGPVQRAQEGPRP